LIQRFVSIEKIWSLIPGFDAAEILYYITDEKVYDGKVDGVIASLMLEESPSSRGQGAG